MKMQRSAAFLVMLFVAFFGLTAKADTDLGWATNVTVQQLSSYPGPVSNNRFVWFKPSVSTGYSISSTAITNGVFSTCTATGSVGKTTAVYEASGNMPLYTLLNTALVSSMYLDVHVMQQTTTGGTCYLAEAYLHR